MLTPEKDVIKPKTARRVGFTPKSKAETIKDQIGAVFTNTVALSMVVSATAETKNTKCSPTRTPKKRTRRKFSFNKLKPKGFLKKKTTARAYVGVGFEVSVRWLQGAVKYRNGRQLLEEVSGNRVVIYSEDPKEAIPLLTHGFAEWLLNQHTKRYRLLINKLIELFEQIQYEEKERIIDAVTKLLTHR